MKQYLDMVMDSIEPNSIIDQMEKILSFLQSNKKELCFTNITPYMENLLLNIVKDKENLAFCRLVNVSNGLSEVIYSILKSTKDVFSLVWEYESGKLNKKVLCYKKLFHNQLLSSDSMILQPHCNQQSSLQPLMARIQANNSQVDRCTLLQKAPKKKKNRNAQKHEDIISANFDSIEDFRVAVLTDPYKYLSIEQTQAVLEDLVEKLEDQIFSQPHSRSGPIPPAFRGRPLLNKGVLRLWCEDDHAMDWLKVQLLDLPSPIAGTTLIVKRLSEIPKFSTNVQRKHPQNEETVKVQNKPDDLSPLFKKVSMQTMLDFINDERRASLVFHQKTLAETMFLTSIGKKAKSNANDNSIPDNCKPLLMKIGASLKKFADFNLNVTEGKMDKKTGLKDVKFVKDPNFTKDPVTFPKDKKTKATDSSSASGHVGTTRSSKTLPPTSDNDVPDLTKLSITDNKKPNKFEDNKWCEKLPPKSSQGSKIVQSNISRARSLSQRRKLSATRINFQPTSTKETVIDKQVEAIDNDRGRSRERKLDGRTSKLLADMSTPMKSDKAMRMMKGMGWDGGALGTRGDGITEPIIPELGIPRKAGLGHILPSKPPTKQTANPPPKLQPPAIQQQPPAKQQQPPLSGTTFQHSFYEVLYDFITSNQTHRQIDYTMPLTKSSIKFVRRTVESINSRGKGKVRICDELNALLMRIMERVHIPPGLRLEVNIFTDNMGVNLQKVTKKKKNDRNVQLVTQTSCVSPQIFLQTMETLPKMILKLIKSNDTEMSVAFDELLTRQQCEFVDNIVKWINRRSGNLSNTGSIFGKAIYSEIKECMNNVVLTTKFAEKLFIIIKVYTDEASFNEVINNNNINIDNNNIFDTDIVMVSDDEYDISVKDDAMTKKDDRISIISDTNCDTTIHETVVAKIEKDPVAEPNTHDGLCNEILVIKAEQDIVPAADPDDFYACLRDLEMCFESETCNTEIKKEIKEETSWENLEDKDFSYNNNTSDLGTEISSFSKRSLPQSDYDSPIMKKVKLEDYKRVCISSKNTEEVLNREKIKEIQTLISDAIDNAVHLTLLNCHGFINGALIYDCYDEKSFIFLKNIVDAASDLSIVERNEDLLGSYKMAIKINSFIDVNVDKMFSKIEMYNPGLWTDDWVFIKKSEYCNYIIITVFIDEKSLKYISDANFSLFAGIDKIQFSIIWD